MVVVLEFGQEDRLVAAAAVEAELDATVLARPLGRVEREIEDRPVKQVLGAADTIAPAVGLSANGGGIARCVVCATPLVRERGRSGDHFNSTIRFVCV